MTLEDRFRHIYIPGKSGYGKSNLITQLALTDIHYGYGCTVLDYKGDAVDKILEWIPEERKDDVYVISGKTPVSIDLLFHADHNERSEVAQQIYAIFTRFMAVTEQRMGPVLEYAINTVMHMEHKCFLDIYHFLAHDDDTYDLAYAAAPNQLKNFWAETYTESYFKHAELPITTRMSSYILLPILKKLLDCREPAINIPAIVESGKILLVNLKSLGGVAGYIIGCLIMSQLEHTVDRRQEIADEDLRTPYFIYADEFQRFKNITFNNLLQQARGFHVGLTLASQHPKQLLDIWDDIIACTSTFYMFQMVEPHARMLASQILPEKPIALNAMPIGTCLYHPATGNTRFEDITLVPKHNPKSVAGYIRNRMVELIALHPPTSRQEKKKDAQLADNDRPSPPRPPRSNSQPQASKRPFSGPRNPK